MVRRADIDDAPAIAQVHVSTWRSTYRGMLPDDFLDSLSEANYAARWRRGIGDGRSRVYVAEDADGTVGFASGGPEHAGKDGFVGELYALYVDDRAQRRGHGRELVHAVADGFRGMGLHDMIIWVLRDNLGARAFYERLGGVYVRTQPIAIGPTLLHEVSYGWRSFDQLR